MGTGAEIKLDLIDRVRDFKKISNEHNSNQLEFINEMDLNVDATQIQLKSRTVYQTLLDEPITEDGGRNALFGFYYQFLIAIDYLIEIGENKWDFMALEIHDDIVLCKESEGVSKIRFIQVKTSKSPTINYTSTELCTRSKKNITEDGGSREIRFTDSWLDKLFSNIGIFKDSPRIKKELELVTNFTLYFSPPSSKDNKTKNINHYRTNELFNIMEINDDDPFYKKLNDSAYDKEESEYTEEKKFNYKNTVGMGLKELLQITKISERAHHLKTLRDSVIKRMGEFLSKKIGVAAGATIIDEDINWLIGEMIANCAAREDKLILFIDKDKAEEILSKLFHKSKTYSEQFNEIVGNKEYIDGVFEKLITNVRNTNPNAIDQFEEVALFIKKLINDWIDSGGDILPLVSRFVLGREEVLAFHVNMHKSDREKYISSLMLLEILLKIIHEDTRISLKYKSLISKEVKTILGSEYELSFIRMEDYYSYEEII